MDQRAAEYLPRDHGPVAIPVPASPQRRRVLSHPGPLEPKPVSGRAGLRQKVASRPPRSISDPRPR